MASMPGLGTKQSPTRVAYRWFSGRPLDGRPRTDCTFLRPGTKALGPIPVRHWSYRPGWHRSAVRQAFLLLLPLLLWAWLQHPQLLAVVAALAVAAGTAIGVRRAVGAWRIRAHTAAYVVPMHAAMSVTLDLPPTVKPTDYLAIPPTFATDETTPSAITMPAHFRPSRDNKAVVEELALAKLGASRTDLGTSWVTTGVPVLLLRKQRQCPDMVSWESMAEAMAACEPGEVVLGMDKNSKPYKGNFNGDDPHWGFSCGSRRGKSTMFQATIAQLLAQDVGAEATCIDVKMTSFEPLAGVPGVTLANNPRDIEGMWSAIAAFRAEMERRMEATDKDKTLTFPIAVLCIDEANQFAAMTAGHWKKVKEKDQPATAPVWEDIAAVFWQGAQFRCHAIVAGQRLDDKATGGYGLRDSLGFRGLAGYRPQQWMMLIGTTPIPRSQKQRGRWIYSDGQSETWVQNVYGTPQQIRDHALIGRRPVSQVDVPTGSHAPETRSGGTGTVIIGLDAAAAHLGISRAAFIQRRKRSDGIPGEIKSGNQPAWPVESLDQFAATHRDKVSS